jgi:hypothetical protein
MAKKQQLPQTPLPSEMHLTCQEVTNLIVDYMTGDLAAATRAAFETHMRGCTDCEAFLNTYRETIRRTRAVRFEDLPADMLKRVEGFLQNRLKGS